MRQLFILFLAIILEVVIVPDGYDNSKLTLNILGYSISIFELLFWFFCWLTLLTMLKRKTILTRLNSNLFLNTKQKVSILVFIGLFCLSVLIGAINNNEYFLRDLRNISFIIPVFYISILNFNIEHFKIKKYYRIVLFSISIVGIGVILSYFSSTFVNVYNSIFLNDIRVDTYGRSFSGELGLYGLSSAALTMLLYFISMANILFKQRHFSYYVMAIIGFLSTVIFFHKPIVVAFVLGNVLMYIFYIYLNKNMNSVINTIKNIIIVALFIVIIVSLIPRQILDSFIEYFQYGWINIGRDGVEDDLSSGRFDLFLEYGTEILKGFGLALWGLGKELTTVSVQTPHNYIIYLAYQLGFIAALMLLYLIFSILFSVLRSLKVYNGNKNSPLYSITFGLLIYQFTILIIAQYSGVLDSLKPYIFLFYSILGILLHIKLKLKKE